MKWFRPKKEIEPIPTGLRETIAELREIASTLRDTQGRLAETVERLKEPETANGC